MTKNYLVNAFLALVYIALVVTVIFYGERIVPGPDDSVILPIAFLSLFVLSAAIMGMIFFFQPLQMYLDGNKKEAVALLTKTVITFAILTVLIFFLILVLNS